MIPNNINFNKEKNTLLLGLDKSEFNLGDIRKTAQENGFEEKSELHITVIGFKNGGEIKKSKAAQEIESLIANTAWSFTLKPQIYRISKDYVFSDPASGNKKINEHRESYIQMVNMPSMGTFYNELNRILGTKLETPPAHITLYTKGDNKEKSKMGIGINSESELKAMDPQLVSI